ncbi:hypothetical protein SOCEGT47_080120 [Sorangium cellulosum]|uniref:Cytochrome c domain-containing protein n=2 Tax=Sorangium cellulosum TaxID=56 RepID=A0A4P2QE27_SORCE|nr:hypothetical protein SOCEGT47_080120 [Sorangium cellulosum]
MRSMNTAGPATNEAKTEAGQPDRAPPVGRRTGRDGAVVRRISAAACLFVAACGGGDDGEPEQVAWQDMSVEERLEYMNDVVLPRMTEVFVAYDTKYQTMTCVTCHGADMAGGTYEMPSAAITPLPDEEHFLEWAGDPAHPEREAFGTFMFEQVVPEMAKLLQVERYDPTTNTGTFSCANCHTVASIQD